MNPLMLISTVVAILAVTLAGCAGIGSPRPAQPTSIPPPASSAATGDQAFDGPPLFVGLQTDEVLARQFADQTLLHDVILSPLLSWELLQRRLPATAEELQQSQLIPYLPTTDDGRSMRLTMGGPQPVPALDELRLDLSDPQLAYFRWDRTISPENPEGVAGTIQTALEVVDYAERVRTVYKQAPRTYRALKTMEGEQLAKGKDGLPASNVMTFSDQFNEWRLWCLLQSVKSMLIIYRNATGRWPDSWDQVLELTHMAPVDGFFTDSRAKTGPQMVAEVSIDRELDLWSLELTPSWGVGTKRYYWIYSVTPTGDFSFDMPQQGLRDSRLAGKTPQLRTLAVWYVSTDPLPSEESPETARGN